MPTVRPLAELGLLAALLGAASVRASELYVYEHNGSVIEWSVVGDRIKATYKRPRPGLAEAGVSEGSVLFEGEYEGSRIVGTAYVFRRGCPPFGYDVIGHEGDGKIVLDGPSPKRSPTGCGIEGYKTTGPNSRLIFNFSATRH